MNIRHAAIVGFGAIGCIYGRRLYNYMGEDFAVIAGGKRAERLRTKGETINGERLMPHVVEPEATDWKADLLIFSVKNTQLDGAIEDCRNVVGPGTVILTIMNGIAARETLQKAFPDNKVFYGLSRSDASRSSEGVICTWEGAIEFGEADNRVISEEVQAVKDLFDAAGIKNTVCEDMVRAVWAKFMRNVSMNQLAAITGAPYGAFFKIPEMAASLREVMEEVVAVAQAQGIDLRQSDVEDSLEIMKHSAPEAKPSTLQDVEAGRPIEIDSFAGSVIAEGKKVGVPTPWNDKIYRLLKVKEAVYLGKY